MNQVETLRGLEKQANARKFEGFKGQSEIRGLVQSSRIVKLLRLYQGGKSLGRAPKSYEENSCVSSQ